MSRYDMIEEYGMVWWYGGTTIPYLLIPASSATTKTTMTFLCSPAMTTSPWSTAKTMMMMIGLVVTTTTVRAAGIHPCNQVIGTLTKQDIADRISHFNSLKFPDNETIRQAMEDATMAPLMYDVLVSKACGTCADFENKMVDFPMYATKYCAPDSYGYGATYSTLVMHPIDPETGNPIAASLIGSVTFIGTRYEVEQAPSTNFTLDFEALIMEDDPLAYLEENVPWWLTHVDLVRPLIAASAGTIAIFGDDIGTGESDEYDRSYLARHPSEQMAVVSWLIAQSYTEQATNGCTQLGNKATVGGYSFGGYKTTFGALAMETIGVEILQTFVQGSPSQLDIIMFGITGMCAQSLCRICFLLLCMISHPLPSFVFVAAFLQDPNLPFNPLLGLIFATNAGDAPYFPHFGTNQTIASFDFAQEVVPWYMEDQLNTGELLGVLPSNNTLSKLNPDYMAAVGAAAAAGSTPCSPDIVTEDIALLCQTFAENAPLTLYSTGAITHPVELCHSPDDTLVPILFSSLMPTDQDNIYFYAPPSPILEPQGSHAVGAHYCTAAVSQYYVRQDGVANAMEPIASDNDGASCVATGASGGTTWFSSGSWTLVLVLAFLVSA
jgi:hypothetical protein